MATTDAKALEPVVAALEAAYNAVKRATDGLSDEDLYRLPSPDTNSMVWLVWHMSRYNDYSTALLRDVPQAWADGGWAARFGMAEDAMGIGDTPEQVKAFQPDRELLFQYAEAVKDAAQERLAKSSGADLDREFETRFGARPGVRVIAGMLGDYIQHTGQIAYVRGLLTGRGWQQV